MISLILYGRNDSYGYNLHKRAAISLNCMAEVLTDPDDEIIFVDYNTPDDFPTFPEAIQDTLTEKAKRLLRILRVRPKHHERFAAKTHLTALEPIARNVAIRRSNPKNRWILSTNTDMVFVPRRGKSLSEIASALPDGYYHLPRFEVPETLWESADRLHPHATIAAFEEWGRDYHLNEIVFAQDPEVRYDAPGDFQLMLRSDAWKIFGFNESMLLGWHVDSNMAKRLWLLRRHVSDVVQDLFGYHCDHTRQVTPMHKPQGTQNDLKVYFKLVRSAAVKKQAKTWGLAGEEIEELSLAATQSYAAALRSATSRPLDEVTTIRYAAETYNQIDYSAEHVLPFLADSISSYPRATVLAWSGAKRSLLHGFARIWREMGFLEPILVFAEDRWLGPDLPDGCIWASTGAACAQGSIFIFDWGKPESAVRDASWNFDRDPTIRQVARHFRSALRDERLRVSKPSHRLRRFIGINVINNAMEGVFSNHIGAARTPIATRIRQGFIVKKRADLFTSLYIGEAGQRVQDGIVALPGKQGYVFFGPYLDLDWAFYRLEIVFAEVRLVAPNRGPTTLDVVSNSRLIACREVTKRDMTSGAVSLDFFLSKAIADALDWPRIEFRLRTSGSLKFKIVRATLDDLGRNQTPLSDELEIAPLLTAGPAGERDGSTLRARKGVADLVGYGPYFWLPEGHYEAEFRFRIDSRLPDGALRAFVAYNLGRIALGAATIKAKRKGVTTCIIPFKVSGEPPTPDFGLLEFLVWSRGTVTSSLLSLKVRPAKAKRVPRMQTISDSGVLSLLSVKRAGRRFPGTIVALSGAGGVVFQSIKLPLPVGGQRFEMRLRQPRAGNFPVQTGLKVEALSRGRVIARHVLTEKELRRGRVAFDFDVTSTSWGEEVEIVLRTKGLLELEITSAELSEKVASRPRVQAPDEMVAISP